MTVSAAYVTAGVIAAALLITWYSKPRRGLQLPPGPKGLPILGNLFDMPNGKDWIAYQRLAQTYGDIVCMKVMGTTIVVLNSAKTIADLLEARSAIYSDRPVRPIFDFFGQAWGFTLFPYGPEWRHHRRLMHEEMQPRAVARYQHIQIRGARILLKRLLQSDEDVHKMIRKYAGASIVDLAYGLENEADVESFAMFAERSSRRFAAISIPGAFLVDYIPALKHIPPWLPFASTQRDAATSRAEMKRLLMDPVEAVQQHLSEGKALPSVLLNLIEKAQSGHMESIPKAPNGSGIYEIPATTYWAGIDTTVSAATFFFIALLRCPEIQVTAQKEIDRVVGHDRLPDFTDLADLPYIQAIILETLRWFTPLPISIPHMTLEDDIYEGYLIPKGSIVLGNSWAVLRNLIDYPEPEVFRPERFLALVDGKFAINKEVRDPRTVAYGFGRRICPGRFLAEQSLFAIYANVLAVYTVLPAVDDQGREIRPGPEDLEPGLILQPAPFRCICKPRSPQAAELIAGPLPDRGL